MSTTEPHHPASKTLLWNYHSILDWEKTTSAKYLGWTCKECTVNSLNIKSPHTLNQKCWIQKRGGIIVYIYWYITSPCVRLDPSFYIPLPIITYCLSVHLTVSWFWNCKDYNIECVVYYEPRLQRGQGDVSIMIIFFIHLSLCHPDLHPELQLFSSFHPAHIHNANVSARPPASTASSPSKN